MAMKTYVAADACVDKQLSTLLRETYFLPFSGWEHVLAEQSSQEESSRKEKYSAARKRREQRFVLAVLGYVKNYLYGRRLHAKLN